MKYRTCGLFQNVCGPSVQKLLGDFETQEGDRESSEDDDRNAVDAADPADLHQYTEEPQAVAQPDSRDTYPRAPGIAPFEVDESKRSCREAE